ncbi:MAG: hypothetical protein AB7O97_21780 [Planctomycetota bacterium]
MVRPVCVLSSFLVCALSAQVPVEAAADAAAPKARDVEAITADLGAARLRYEERMDALRAAVRARFDRAIEAQNQPGDRDMAAIRALVAARDGFGARAEWPELDGIDELRQQEAQAAQDMHEAYATAYVDFDKAGKGALRSAIDAEMKLFDTHVDRRPWLALDLGAPTVVRDEAGREIGRRFALPAQGGYRLELRARCVGGDEPIELDLPRSDGEWVRLRVPVDADGACRVLLTSAKNVLSAELGVPRPVATGSAPGAEGHGVIVRGDEGRILLDALRWKPLVEGRPEQVEETTEQADAPDKAPIRKAAPRKSVSDLLPVGRQVTASRTLRGGAPISSTGSVTVNNGKRIVARLTAGNSQWDWVFEVVRDRNLRLVDIRMIRNPNRGFRIWSPGGTFTVGENGTIRGNYRFHRNGRGEELQMGNLTIESAR